MKLRNQILGGTIILSLLSGGSDSAYASIQNLSAGKKLSAGAQLYAQSTTASTKTTVAKIIDTTNLRKGPGLEFEVVAKAKAGETYPVVESEGEWYKVSLSSGGTAYVANWVVETVERNSNQSTTNNGQNSESVDHPSSNKPNEVKVNIVNTTNLRKGPGIDYEIVAKAKAGESFPVVGLEGDWYQVSLPSGGTAYVANWVVNTGVANQSGSKVYIYHTHNRESWKNVSTKKGTSFDDPKVNITLVGKKLAEILHKKGIGSISEETDIAERLNVQKLSFTKAYSESRKAVEKALKSNASLSYFFDIHRDADIPRNKTTVEIKGKTYARIMFVIGDANPAHKENKKFAEALSVLLNKKYPGISRGVLMKSAHQGNAEYNQSVSKGSLLMEFGGVNNTLEENLQTAEAFADVFAEYYKSLK